MNKTIFIVEDDLDISELIQIVVEGEGYKVKAFTDHADILTALRQDKPDLILMDLWISGTDSGELIKTLKKRKDTQEVPVIIISAKNSLEKTVKQTGADGFLSKPFNIQDLVKIIKKFA
jgi:DNA-binding response OmpR family regulator